MTTQHDDHPEWLSLTKMTTQYYDQDEYDDHDQYDDHGARISMMGQVCRTTQYDQTWYLSKILHQHIFKTLKIYPKKTRKSRLFKP